MGRSASTPLLQKLRLTTDDGLAGAQDGAFALLDVTNQLQCGAIALLDVLFDLTVGVRLRQHPAIALIEPERRDVFFVHHDHEFVASFGEHHVRLDQPRFGAVVALAGTGIQRADQIYGLLHVLLRLRDGPGQRSKIALLQQRQAMVDDLRCRMKERATV